MTEKEKNNESSGFTDDANSLKKAKKRPIWKTIIVRIFQAVGLLVLFIIGYCILITFAKPHITVDYVEKMNELSRLSDDESLNAAHDYKKAFEAYKSDPNLEKLIGQKQNIKDFNETELTAVRRWIADNNAAIDYYLKAAQKPYCWWDRKLEDPNESVLSLLMPELAELRKMSKLMLISAQLDIQDENADKAFNKICSCFKSGLHLKGPRTLIEQLVGFAIQALSDRTAGNILSNEKISSEQLKELQTKLEDIAAKDYPQACFDAERFLLYDCMQRWFTDERLFGGRPIPSNELATLSGDGELSLTAMYALSLVSASRAELAKFMNDYYNEFDELSKLTPYQGREKIKEVENKLNSLTGIKGVRYWVPRVLFPALGKVVIMSYRNKTLNDSTICIIASHRSKLDKGSYPDTLDQLQQAGYIKSVPMDPWSDKSLVYKKTGDDFILYSVGENFTDDGGTSGKGNNGKFWEWADNGDVIFWPPQQ